MYLTRNRTLFIFHISSLINNVNIEILKFAPVLTNINSSLLCVSREVLQIRLSDI